MLPEAQELITSALSWSQKEQHWNATQQFLFLHVEDQSRIKDTWSKTEKNPVTSRCEEKSPSQGTSASRRRTIQELYPLNPPIWAIIWQSSIRKPFMLQFIRAWLTKAYLRGLCPHDLRIVLCDTDAWSVTEILVWFVQFNISFILASSSHDLEVVSAGFWYLLVDTVAETWQWRSFADGSIPILPRACPADSNLGETPPGFQSKITFIHTSCLNQSSFKL